MKKHFTALIIIFSVLVGHIYSQETIHNFLEELNKTNYVIDFYYDVLKSGNRDTMHNFSDIYVDREFPDPDYGIVKYKWYDSKMFPMDSIKIRIDNASSKIDDKCFQISNHWIDIIEFQYRNNIEIVFKEGSDLNDFYDSYSTLDWKKTRQKELNTFYFNFDGDYLCIYLNGETDNDLFARFVKMNNATFKQFKNLLANNKCDLTYVTWPKHADGSCDYDINKKSASTNVAQNKLMVVSENLKLRSGEATSTQVLTVMSAGTKVKILELGKAESIDGINSNWVKVEVQSGAKDRDGNAIKAGTVGWCYGGYLE